MVFKEHLVLYSSMDDLRYRKRSRKLDISTPDNFAGGLGTHNFFSVKTSAAFTQP